MNSNGVKFPFKVKFELDPSWPFHVDETSRLNSANPPNRGHRRDAYDTLGSVTCLTLRPSEKYHRPPACAAE
jgi:hypothetical protein